MKSIRLRLLCLGLALAHGAVLAQHHALAQKVADDESTPTESLAAEPAPVLPPVLALKVKLASGDPSRLALLRIVKRSSSAGMVAANVGFILVGAALVRSGGGSFQHSFGFSKNDLSGSEVDGLSDAEKRLLDNPARTELVDGVARLAAQFYQSQPDAQHALPPDFEPPIEIESGKWTLVYETLLEGEESFRLQWDAEIRRIGTGGPFRRPVNVLCGYQSAEPATLAQWQADGWQRLRDERAQALDGCIEVTASRLPVLLQPLSNQ